MGNESGTLYLVATPLGNLQDITLRALKILAEVDLIAAEDTRHTLKLLNHFQIKQKLISYHQHNERSRAGELIRLLSEGQNIALVSDAGMPGISDPGYQVVAEAVQQGLPVVPIPGPSAVVTALAASGLSTESFRFEGFLPRKLSERTAILNDLAGYHGTIIFYESPRRVGAILKHCLEVLGEREVVLARELTKIHEEFIRGQLSELADRFTNLETKGEFTILIAGAKPGNNRQDSTNLDFSSLLGNLGKDHESLRKKLKKIAQETGLSVKEVYERYLAEQKK